MLTLKPYPYPPLGCESTSATVKFEGKTVREVLEEIREYAKNNKYAGYMGEIGDHFGNPRAKWKWRWDITLRDPKDNKFEYIITGSVSIWDKYQKRYNHEWDDRPVKKVYATAYIYEGSWLDFEIIVGGEKDETE